MAMTVQDKKLKMLKLLLRYMSSNSIKSEKDLQNVSVDKLMDLDEIKNINDLRMVRDIKDKVTKNQLISYLLADADKPYVTRIKRKKTDVMENQMTLDNEMAANQIHHDASDPVQQGITNEEQNDTDDEDFIV